MTKLSSAGLVYVHFGRQLLAQLMQLKEGDRRLEVLYNKVREGRCFCFSFIVCQDVTRKASISLNYSEINLSVVIVLKIGALRSPSAENAE